LENTVNLFNIIGTLTRPGLASVLYLSVPYLTADRGYHLFRSRNPMLDHGHFERTGVVLAHMFLQELCGPDVSILANLNATIFLSMS
jgi:hypothetical protein